MFFLGDEFVYLLGKFTGIQLVAKLDANLKTLGKVNHVHVGKDFLMVFGQDAHSHSVKQKFVDFLLFVLNVALAWDRLTEKVFIVIL